MPTFSPATDPRNTITGAPGVFTFPTRVTGHVKIALLTEQEQKGCRNVHGPLNSSRFAKLYQLGQLRSDERQTDRETDGGRETDRQKERGRQRERETKRERERQLRFSAE